MNTCCKYHARCTNRATWIYEAATPISSLKCSLKFVISDTSAIWAELLLRFSRTGQGRNENLQREPKYLWDRWDTVLDQGVLGKNTPLSSKSAHPGNLSRRTPTSFLRMSTKCFDDLALASRQDFTLHSPHTVAAWKQVLHLRGHPRWAQGQYACSCTLGQRIWAPGAP